MLTRWMFRLVVWILNRLGAEVVAVSDEVSRVIDAADVFVSHYDASPHIPGEAKRHQVYARLVKSYPTVPRYVLGLALELAVHRRRFSGGPP